MKTEALRRTKEGTKFFGSRLQKGKTMRTFGDEKKVAEILEKNGIDPWAKRLRGVADIEKACPHYSIMAELEPYIVTETKSPTLVAVKTKAEA